MSTDFSHVIAIQAMSADGGGTDQPFQRELQTWLAEEGAGGFAIQSVPVSSSDAAGKRMDALSILLVILGTKAAVKGIEMLGKALIAWIQARRPHVILTVRVGDRMLQIDAKNPPRLEELTAQMSAMAGTKAVS